MGEVYHAMLIWILFHDNILNRLRISRSILLAKENTEITFEPGEFGFRLWENTISKIYPGSQAERMNLYKGLQVVSVNGKKYKNNAFMNAIQRAKKEKKPMTIAFKDPRFVTDVVNETSEMILLNDILDHEATFEPDTFGITYKGNVVTDVVPGSQADLNDVSIGMTIESINDMTISASEEEEEVQQTIIKEAI